MPKTPEWLERLIGTLQDAANTETGRALRGDVEDILNRRFGPKLPNAVHAQTMSASIRAVLEEVIAICEDDQRRLGGVRGWHPRHNPVTIRLAIQRLRGAVNGMERAYSQLQPVAAAHSGVLFLPPSVAGEAGDQQRFGALDHMEFSQNTANLLLAIYRDTIFGARQILDGISGGNAASGIAVEGAFEQFHALIIALQAAVEALR